MPLASLTASRRFEIEELFVPSSFIPASEYAEGFGSFSLDLDNALINDFQMEVCVGYFGCDSSPTDHWVTDTINNIKITDDGLAIFPTVYGAYNSTPDSFTGRIRGGFTASTASNDSDGFFAGFQFIEDSEAAYLAGAALFSESHLLGTSEAESLNKIGFAIFDGEPVELPFTRAIYGPASDSTGRSPVIAESYSSDYLTDPIGANTGYHIIRDSGATLVQPSEWLNVGGFSGLNWGLWVAAGEGGVNPLFSRYANDISTSRQDYNLLEDVLFSTGDATSTTYLDSLFASKRFSANHSVSPFTIISSTGTSIWEFEAQYEIDLFSGIVGGSFEFRGCAIDCSALNITELWQGSFGYTHFANTNERGFRSSDKRHGH